MNGAGRMRGIAISLAACLGGACGSQSTAYPLYAKVGAGPGPEKVATLYGPVQTVDDQNVAAKGRTFELLPGCHVVTLQRNIGEGSATGAWAANLPRLVVAFEMKPAHRYIISSTSPDSSAPVGRIVLTATEKAPDGNVVRVPFARSDEDIRNCRNWATSQGL
ncbi:MAG TPA: hypothetical protein VKQ32_07205 [Polyangia bacterium]|nr:hypothetical protein [Polyangia bacterium]